MELTEHFDNIKETLSSLSAEDGLMWLSNYAGDNIRFSSAFGMEDQVITHMIAKHRLPVEVFTLDTGRLFQETYDLIDLTRKKYNLDINVYFPDQQAIQELTRERGVNSFYDSVENRKACCFIRKVEPLRRALKGASVWITGLRAGQSINRQSFDVVSWDVEHQVIKYNPILGWTQDEMELYIRDNKVPVNVLHKQGFPSIGCAPCTRAILPGEDVRAGRWWWESSAKECGLHEVKAAS